MACSARLVPFSLLAFCLCCSSSGKCNCSEPGNSHSKSLLPKPSFVLGGSFQTLYAGRGDCSGNQTTRTCNSNQNKCFATPRRVKTESGGSLGDAAQGPRWEAAASFAEGCVVCVSAYGWKCEGEDGSWKRCPSQWRGAPRWLSSSAGCVSAGVWAGGMGAVSLPACVCLPSAVHQNTQGARGAGVLAEVPIPPHPHLLRGTLQGISQPGGNCCLCQNKNLGAWKSQRAPSKTSVQHKSSRLVSDTAGWEVA